MSANVNTMFSVREMPWHNNATILDKCPTSAEAIIAAGLNFTVSKQPIFAMEKEIPGYFATVRDDNNDSLGIVKGTYTVVQNSDAFKFFDEIVGADEAIYETAGCLGKGEIIWIAAKLPQYIRIAESDDLINQYLLLTAGHNGSHGIQCMFTPVRVVCNNTLMAALQSNQRQISIHHTKSAAKELEIAHKVMGIIVKETEETSALYNAFAKTIMLDKEFLEYVLYVMMHPKEYNTYQASDEPWHKHVSTRKENQINTILNIRNSYKFGQDMRTCIGTLWGAYNAITSYIHNIRTYKDYDYQFKSELMGHAAKLNVRALNSAQHFMTSGSVDPRTDDTSDLREEEIE